MVSRTHFSMLNTGRCQHLLFGMGLPLEGKLEAKARGFDTAVSKVRTRDFGRMMDRAGQDSFGLRVAEPNVATSFCSFALYSCFKRVVPVGHLPYRISGDLLYWYLSNW